MQVSLFRALKSINIEDEIAERAVKVVEEHIEMSVARAVQPLESKIDMLVAKIDLLVTKSDVLGTKVDGVSTTNQSTIASLRSEMQSVKWVSVGVTALLAVAGTAAGMAAKLFF